MSMHEINNKFSINIPFTTYFSIIRQIKIICKNVDESKTYGPCIPNFLSLIMADIKGSKRIYNRLNTSGGKFKNEIKWENTLNLSNFSNKYWQRHYIIPFKVTNDTKLQWLQYRIFHRILATNSYLLKINYIDSELCTFCNTESETIIHLFWECQYVHIIWVEFIRWVNTRSRRNLSLCEKDAILGICEASDIINLLIILLKSYVYQYRMKKSIPTYNGFITYVKEYQKVEKILYCKKNQVQKFEYRWKDFMIV